MEAAPLWAFAWSVHNAGNATEHDSDTVMPWARQSSRCLELPRAAECQRRKSVVGYVGYVGYRSVAIVISEWSTSLPQHRPSGRACTCAAEFLPARGAEKEQSLSASNAWNMCENMWKSYSKLLKKERKYIHIILLRFESALVPCFVSWFSVKVCELLRGQTILAGQCSQNSAQDIMAALSSASTRMCFSTW